MLGIRSRLRGGGSLIAAQDCFHARHKLFGVKWFLEVIVRPKLETKYLVKDFPFCGEHNNRCLRFLAYFAAHLIAVNARKHQIQQD